MNTTNTTTAPLEFSPEYVSILIVNILNFLVLIVSVFKNSKCQILSDKGCCMLDMVDNDDLKTAAGEV